ncbi:MAG: phosphoribosyl-ATP diphosphatase [Polyangiaceae bacterium]|nr:phosphoribosyl-ATP diphosphatase [Polyangiaceae bacterium]
MWYIVQHRLTGTVLGAVPQGTKGFDDIGPGAHLEYATRSWRVRGRYSQVGEGPILLLVDAADGEDAPPESTFQTPGEDEAVVAARPFLSELEQVIEARKRSTAIRSYTRSLLDGGAHKIGEKLREEADELGGALAGESEEQVASEAADVLFHLLVALSARDLALSTVVAVLAKRFGISGHVEKASRAPAAR